MKKTDIIGLYAAMNGFEEKDVRFEVHDYGEGRGGARYTAILSVPDGDAPPWRGASCASEGRARDALGSAVKSEADKRFEALYQYLSLNGSKCLYKR